MRAEIAEFGCRESRSVFLPTHIVLEGCQRDSRPRSARCLRIIVHSSFRCAPKPSLLLRPRRFHVLAVTLRVGRFIVRGDSVFYCRCRALALFPLPKAPSIDRLIRLPIVLRSFYPSCFPSGRRNEPRPSIPGVLPASHCIQNAQANPLVFAPAAQPAVSLSYLQKTVPARRQVRSASHTNCPA